MENAIKHLFLKVNNNKGQSILELATFGAIILFVWGVLLGYMQQTDDQQYTQMESFRRGLAYASNPPLLNAAQNLNIPGARRLGAGASVDYNLIRNRRYVGAGDFITKGEPQTVSASSSLYWAVPYVGKTPFNLTVYKINDGAARALTAENIFNNLNVFLDSGDLADLQKYVSISTQNIDTKAESKVKQVKRKQEDEGGIVNTRSTMLNESITTTVYASIKPQIPADLGSETQESLINWINGMLGDNVNARFKQLEVEQRMYRRPNGQISYSEIVPESYWVTKERKWETPHAE